jgi:hypothetical protein
MSYELRIMSYEIKVRENNKYIFQYINSIK